MEIKPGWKTTEWWATVIVQLISALTLFGVINASEGATLEASLKQGLLGVSALLASVWSVVELIKGRVQIKSEAAQTERVLALQMQQTRGDTL